MGGREEKVGKRTRRTEMPGGTEEVEGGVAGGKEGRRKRSAMQRNEAGCVAMQCDAVICNAYCNALHCLASVRDSNCGVKSRSRCVKHNCLTTMLAPCVRLSTSRRPWASSSGSHGTPSAAWIGQRSAWTPLTHWHSRAPCGLPGRPQPDPVDPLEFPSGPL